MIIINHSYFRIVHTSKQRVPLEDIIENFGFSETRVESAWNEMRNKKISPFRVPYRYFTPGLSSHCAHFHRKTVRLAKINSTPISQIASKRHGPIESGSLQRSAKRPKSTEPRTEKHPSPNPYHARRKLENLNTAHSVDAGVARRAPRKRIPRGPRGVPSMKETGPRFTWLTRAALNLRCGARRDNYLPRPPLFCEALAAL